MTRSAGPTLPLELTLASLFLALAVVPLSAQDAPVTASPSTPSPPAATTPEIPASTRLPGLPEETTREYLFGVPGGVRLEALVHSPRLVGTTYYVYDDKASGERRLGGYAEFHAVYDLPVDALWDVLLDIPSYPTFSPRILGAEIESAWGSVYRVRYTTGIRFLGIEVSYDAIEDVTVQTFLDGSRGTRTRLVQSLDGSVFEHFSSFFVAPVTVGGREMAFVRYFSRPGIRNPGFGMLQVVQFFAAPEGKGQVNAVAKEAARRLGRRLVAPSLPHGPERTESRH